MANHKVWSRGLCRNPDSKRRKVCCAIGTADLLCRHMASNPGSSSALLAGPCLPTIISGWSFGATSNATPRNRGLYVATKIPVLLTRPRILGAEWTLAAATFSNGTAWGTALPLGERLKAFCGLREDDARIRSSSISAWGLEWLGVRRAQVKSGISQKQFLPRHLESGTFCQHVVLDCLKLLLVCQAHLRACRGLWAFSYEALETKTSGLPLTLAHDSRWVLLRRTPAPGAP